MRGSHFAIQLFVAFLFYMVHFKMLAKVCSLKVQAERISKSVHSKGAHLFFWWCILKCGPLPNGLLGNHFVCRQKIYLGIHKHPHVFVLRSSALITITT